MVYPCSLPLPSPRISKVLKSVLGLLQQDLNKSLVATLSEQDSVPSAQPSQQATAARGKGGLLPAEVAGEVVVEATDLTLLEGLLP